MGACRPLVLVAASSPSSPISATIAVRSSSVDTLALFAPGTSAMLRIFSFYILATFLVAASANGSPLLSPAGRLIKDKAVWSEEKKERGESRDLPTRNPW